MSVKVERSVAARCTPEHAWRKFQKIEEWPWWNRVVGQAKWVSGQPWQPGSEFALEIVYPKRMSLKPAVTENAAPESVAWRGDGASMRFRFQAQADGATLLGADAEFSGLKAILSGGAIGAAMQRSLEEWLTALKIEAEKIAREEHARS